MVILLSFVSVLFPCYQQCYQQNVLLPFPAILHHAHRSTRQPPPPDSHPSSPWGKFARWGGVVTAPRQGEDLPGLGGGGYLLWAMGAVGGGRLAAPVQGGGDSPGWRGGPGNPSHLVGLSLHRRWCRLVAVVALCAPLCHRLPGEQAI